MGVKSLIDTKDKNAHIVSAYNGDYYPQNGGDIKHMIIDIMEKDKYLDLAMSFNPAYIIHCASIGSPDYADKNREHTWNVNVKGTSNIVDVCNASGARMI